MGHFPLATTEYCGENLGQWVSSQRQHWFQRQKEGEINWRIAKLNELEFVWDPRNKERNLLGFPIPGHQNQMKEPICGAILV
mmetsp:Transcript_29572/g.81276  ORF Transcript_29572/g.81276 Transcript_29572/m.81276 type:complete len:82 (-) Transcript_29572:65-310(-)